MSPGCWKDRTGTENEVPKIEGFTNIPPHF